MPVEVRISSKHRSLSIPVGTKKLVDDVLEKAGFGEVVFEMCGGPRVHATSHTQGVRVGKVEGHSVVLTVQPGNNTTRSRYHLYVPKDLDPEEVREHLLSASGVEIVTKEAVMPNGHEELVVDLPDPADVWVNQGQNGEVVEVVKDDSVPPPQPAPVKNLRGFMRQFDVPNGDVDMVILVIHEKWKLDHFCSRDCAEVIKDVCQLNGASAKSLGVVVGYLAKRGYLERTRISPTGKHLYRLGPKGKELVGVKVLKSDFNIVGADDLREVLARLEDLMQKAERFCAALAVKEAVAREREALQFRLEELQFEEGEAAAALSDPEFQTAAQKIQEIGGFLVGSK